MPRIVVPLVTGEMYHVFNRGVDKRQTFLDQDDFVRLYHSLQTFNTVEPIINFKQAHLHRNKSKQPLVAVYAYSLLPNHYHLLLKQLVDGGVSEFMKRVNGGYTLYFNEKNERSGSLFQGTFKRVLISGQKQLQYLFAYINENHHVHGIERPQHICFSSSNHYQGIQTSNVIAKTNLYTTYSVKESTQLAEDIFQKRAADVLSNKDLLE